MEILTQVYDEVVNSIIRPPRAEYEVKSLIGPVFRLKGNIYKRNDFELTNPRGLKLQCSQYMPVVHYTRMPVVVYCHGNAGSRQDAEEIVPHLLPMGISVVAFDFAGSGLSDGEFVSLGYYEQHDLTTVVDHLRKAGTTTRIGLWGRSMGAATSLMFGVSDPSVAAMILDSPFSSLKTLAMELVDKWEHKLPKMVVGMGFNMVKKTVEKKAKFNIEKLEPIKSASACFIPALFAHGDADDFIAPSHSKAIHEAYAGDKNLIIVRGDHNSSRPGFFHDSVSIFLSNTLLVDMDFGVDNPLMEEAEAKQAAPPTVSDMSTTFDYLTLATALNGRGQDDDLDDELNLAIQLSLIDNGQNPSPAGTTSDAGHKVELEPEISPESVDKKAPKKSDTKKIAKDAKAEKKKKREKEEKLLQKQVEKAEKAAKSSEASKK